RAPRPRAQAPGRRGCVRREPTGAALASVRARDGRAAAPAGEPSSAPGARVRRRPRGRRGFDPRGRARAPPGSRGRVQACIEKRRVAPPRAEADAMHNRDTRAILDYHEATKHSEWSIRTSRHDLDWENQPLPFKVYRDLEPIRLVGDFAEKEIPALE